MKDYPNLVTMWTTQDCVAERCTKCRTRWLTVYQNVELGGVRCRFTVTEDGMLCIPEKYCDDCAEIYAELKMITEE